MPSLNYLRRMRLRRAVASVLGGKTSGALRDFYRSFVPYMAHKVKTDTMWGDWFGNDTIWRTTLDLNLVQLHASPNGKIDLNFRRSFLGIVDGVVGMDHEAPMAGLPRDSNVLIGARDPVAADTIGSFLMGFDPRKIPTIKNSALKPHSALGDPHIPLDCIDCKDSIEDMQQEYVPNKGWKEWLLPYCKTWPYEGAK